jgi:hypothetical protein
VDEWTEPVDEFIEALDKPDRQAAIDFQIDRLNTLTELVALASAVVGVPPRWMVVNSGHNAGK